MRVTKRKWFGRLTVIVFPRISRSLDQFDVILGEGGIVETLQKTVGDHR